MDAQRALAKVMIVTGLLLAPFALFDIGDGDWDHNWDHNWDHHEDHNWEIRWSNDGLEYRGPLDD